MTGLPSRSETDGIEAPVGAVAAVLADPTRLPSGACLRRPSPLHWKVRLAGQQGLSGLRAAVALNREAGTVDYRRGFDAKVFAEMLNRIRPAAEGDVPARRHAV